MIRKTKIGAMLIVSALLIASLAPVALASDVQQTDTTDVTKNKAMIAAGNKSYSKEIESQIVANTQIPATESIPQNIDGKSLMPYVNYRPDINRNPIKDLLKQVKDDKIKTKSSALAAASANGDAWAYSATSSPDFNCYAYSQGYTFWLNPGDIYFPNGGLAPNPDQFQIQCYFDADVIAYDVYQDLLAVGVSSRKISGPTDTISSDERRIALRVGVHDFNKNGIIELTEGEADYHFMLQHSNGAWSEKHGARPSVYDGFINPSTFSWDMSTVKNYYDSKTVYIAIK